MTNDTHAHDGLDSGGKQNQIFLLFLPVHSKFHEFVQLPKGHFSFKARHKKIKFKLVIEHQKNRNQRTNRNEKELFETLFAAAAAFCCNRKTKKKHKKYHRFDPVPIEFLFFGASKNKHIEQN